MPPKKRTAAAPSTSSNTNSTNPSTTSLAGKSVIITGEISGQTRKSAEQILAHAGAKIEKSLNKKVQLVVLGENPGPAKLEKIEQLGVETVEWEEVMREIGDGDGDGKVEDKDEGDDGEKEEEEQDEEEDEEKAKPKGKTKAANKTKSTATSKSKPSSSSKTNSNNNSNDDFSISGRTVLISGTIPGHDRKSSQKAVEDCGASVAKSLNKSVDLLILGTNPGPDKLDKAKDMGVEMIQWDELASKLNLSPGSNAKSKKVTTDVDVNIGEPPESIEGVTVLVTGAADGYTRDEAKRLLEKNGASVAKSLNKSVELVVLGNNPGPEKLEKISELGIGTCGWEKLVGKLGAGKARGKDKTVDADGEDEGPKRKRVRRG